VKIVALPTKTAAVIAALRAQWPACVCTAQPGLGVVFAHVVAEVDARPADDVAAQCRRSGWTAVTVSAPPGWHGFPAHLDGSHMPTRLIRAVKASFDPQGVLDPGRLPAGV